MPDSGTSWNELEMAKLKEQTELFLTNAGYPILWDKRKSFFHKGSTDGPGLPTEVHSLVLRTKTWRFLKRTKNSGDPFYNHCLAVFIDTAPIYEQSKSESISETVIIIFGILYMGKCSKKKPIHNNHLTLESSP